MMKKALFIFLLLCLMSTPALASPFVSPNLSVKIGDHRWGIWRIVDTTSHDPEVLANTSWISSGHPDEEPTVFRTYWVLGLGPFLALHVTQGTLVVIFLAIVLIVAGKVYLRRRRKTEQSPGGDSLKAAPQE
jgi:hypothetical protein